MHFFTLFQQPLYLVVNVNVELNLNCFQKGMAHDFKPTDSLFRIFDQTSDHKVIVISRNHTFLRLVEGKWHLLNLFLDLPLILPHKVQSLEDELVGDHPQRPYVHFISVFLFFEHFGSHIGQGTHGQIIILLSISKAKIPYFKNLFGPAVDLALTTKNVFRLYVPVSNAQFVHVSDTLTQAVQYLNCL